MILTLIKQPAFLILAIIAGAGCRNNPGNKKRTNNPIKAVVNDSISGRFSGMFPCADCSGLRIDLTLNPDSGYILKRTYIASPSGDTTFVLNGTWSLRKGNKYNPGSVLCVLKPDDSARMQLFKVVSKDTLLQLDRKGREINSPFNASLVRLFGQ